jgi:hypothetical protein
MVNDGTLSSGVAHLLPLLAGSRGEERRGEERRGEERRGEERRGEEEGNRVKRE